MITLEKKHELIELGFELRRLKGKRPAFKGSFQQGDSVRDILDWSGNLGVLTGRLSGVVCLDLDVHGDVNGIENLTNYMKERELKFPDTRQIKSPTGGLHLYFKLPVREFEERFAPNLDVIKGLDFRNHNQFMVLEGSETEKGEYKVVNDVAWRDIPVCPKWILDLYRREKATDSNDGTPTFIASKLMEWSEGMSAGNRNIWLTRQVGFMIRQNMTLQAVYEWASIINVNFIKPPVENEEIVAMINSVNRAEQAKRGRK